MQDSPRVACFTERPHKEPGEKGVYAITAGCRWNSVFIEVSVETYLSARFTDWMRNCIFPRLMLGGNIRVAILDGRVN